MSYRYLLLPRIAANGANAQPAAWLVQPPALTAFAGFVTALSRKIGAGAHCGFAVFHHNHQLLADRLSYDWLPHQFRAASLIDADDYPSAANGHGSKPLALSSQPSARCHIEVTIVVRYPAGTPINPEDVERFLLGGRLAGGTISSFGTPDVEGLESDDDVRQRVGSGFAMTDRSDLLALGPDDRDPLDALLRATSPVRHLLWPLSGAVPTAIAELRTRVQESGPLGRLATGKVLRWTKSVLRADDAVLGQVAEDSGHAADDADTLMAEAKADSSWLCPTCIGYLLVTSPAVRQHARAGLPHAYAEPLVGLLQYQPIRDSKQVAWWTMTHPHQRVFALRANNP